ncbi:flavin reductase family protein [Cellulomonas fimi]|uniref:Flavin reductase domain protein FMN-binding protein n=1 Tax=Cellulomonas fimi (strain ATCC 484 / DSM 20113 / JCM 1341 / CCUG 24087 / LMG 16345 / NBRC 15513 / NCIMB 8980 / NCTC 7547 / NRS-133) TaxID=590998 RepID=F4H2F5_CELFA|nr:flavin reductase family protein [Cellulomonas fimi]AEE47575.1 flavin reductase domain protein FMN-binding protein [Cellulomonas fimi ATCC 484]NNH09186.1 flavin reductase family protein [Cellulomonas fimi]VEH36565.1 Flavin-dependent monooxygenase, reductase subunit HsaB [Cellulomonas fimi]
MTAEVLRALDADLAQQDEPQLSPDAYKEVFRRHPAGVAVVTLRDEDRLVGFTATSVISVSAAPPLLAFSLASTSSSWPAVARARTLAISFLSGAQDDVSARFATSGIDRFAAGGWTALPSGEPVIDGAVSWVRGRVVQRTPVGGSYLVSVRALAHGTTTEVTPLVYHDRTYHRIGDATAI